MATCTHQGHEHIVFSCFSGLEAFGLFSLLKYFGRMSDLLMKVISHDVLRCCVT